jgi:hypothetical protein
MHANPKSAGQLAIQTSSKGTGRLSIHANNLGYIAHENCASNKK